MRQEVTTWYEFHELSEEAQAKAVEQMREDLADTWDGEHHAEWLKDQLEMIGFSDVKIAFTGFWSQGDGASFTGEYSPDLEELKRNRKLINETFLDSVDAINALIRESASFQVERIYGAGNYYHEYTIHVPQVYNNEDCPEHGDDCHAACEWEPDWEKEDELCKKLTEHVRDICREIYASLEADYESNTSAEYARQYIEDMGDYEFKEDGTQ